jgi:glycosyltransferase involved in cell wall biosynthesis
VKVMLLIDSLSNGGAERQLTLLAAGLPQAWQRRVCALGDGPFAARLRDQGVPVSVFPRGSRRDLLPAVGLWRSLLASSPDIVHSWGWMSTMAVGPLCRLAGVPLIDGTVRSGVPETDHPHLRRLGMAFAATIVANSRAGLLASSGARAKGIVVYNGFDWSRVDAAHVTMRADDCPAGGAQRPFIVVMTGRMVPVKDFRTVIRAARLLCQGNRAWRFVLIGDGEDRAQLMSEAADLVNEGIVEYPEPDLEVLQHVRRAHAGVLMTNPAYGQEGLSNSIMEYMACGLPVVCGEGGGNREVVLDGTTGFVIPPSDAGELARKLVWLREHESERKAMGNAGRRRIDEVFSIERMVAGFVGVYENALGVSRRD